MTASLFLADFDTFSLARLMSEADKSVCLLPVGSTEPHGPHLPLSTDTLISEGACKLAAETLREKGFFAVVAPSLPYGVTDFAAGFRGGVSIPASVLTPFVSAIVSALLADGFHHVCLSSNHLEPAHDTAVRAALAELGSRASVASPLTRRHGRRLTPEYKSGACHAGQYESSIVLAVRPDLVNEDARAGLPSVGTSLSQGIQQGQHSFKEMGLTQAYTGSPQTASAEEGKETLAILADLIVVEVLEGLQATEGPTSPG